MADVNSNLDSWSSIESSNAPSNSTVVGAGIDDNFREIQACVRRYLASKGGNIASSSSIDLSAATGLMVDITHAAGTTAISSLGTLSAGMWKILRFSITGGTLTLTHNATSLILPGASNITLGNGDCLIAISLGSGNWQIVSFTIAAAPPGGVPVGGIVNFGGATAPTGFLLCYGQAVSRTTYSTLFSIFSTTYGVGDGSTTFNLPDCRGRSVFGKDDMGGSAASRVTTAGSGVDGLTLGATGGNQLSQSHNHTGTSDTENTTHNHTASVNDAGHGHNTLGKVDGNTPGTSCFSYNGSTQNGNIPTQNATTNITVDIGTENTLHTHTFTTSSSGSGSSQNMPPAMVMSTIVKS